MIRLKSLSIALLLSLSLTAPAIAEATLKETLNIAGRQRMLTQKMSKELLMVHLGINQEENAKALVKTKKLFESSLNDIIIGTDKIKGVRDPQAFKDLMDAVSIWNNFYILAEDVAKNKKTSKGHISLTSEFNIPLLEKSNKAVQSIAKSAGDSGVSPKLSNTINIAGRQRMLTQKMSKEFFFILSNYRADHYRNELKKTYKLFNDSLLNLRNGNNAQNILSPISPEVANQLDTVNTLWNTFKQPITTAMNGGKISTSAKNIVVSQNVPLLKEMNKAVQLYSR